MSGWEVLAVVMASAVLVYIAFVAGLLVAGRRSDARALAGFVPDCAVLFKRLLREPQIPRSAKVLLVGLVVYLMIPFDLVPDFIPVAGQLDDAIIVALVLRRLIRSADAAVIATRWPGPPASLALLLRLWGGART